MNDFTKDELYIFHEELDCGIYDELRSKIQCLIDNYCEHKEIVTGAYPRSNPPKKCDYCGVLYYDNQ